MRRGRLAALDPKSKSAPQASLSLNLLKRETRQMGAARASAERLEPFFLGYIPRSSAGSTGRLMRPKRIAGVLPSAPGRQ